MISSNEQDQQRQKYNQYVDAAAVADPHFYSHAVSAPHGSGRLVITSGQVGASKDGNFPTAFCDQVKQALQNLEAVLEAAGAQIRDVVKLTWYCVDWKLAEAQDLVKPTLDFLTDLHGLRHRPATTLVPVAQLADPRAKFEVEAIAVIAGSSLVWDDGKERIEHSVAPVEVDVVVVGGGFSGLQAAYDVHSSGLSVLLLEAKQRIGGRSHTFPLRSGKGMVELGATWINKTTQPKVYALTQKFGLDCIPQYQKGESVVQDEDGKIWRVKEGTLPKPLDGASDIYELLSQLELEQSRVDVSKPESFPTSTDCSVEEWIQKKKFTPYTAGFMRHFVRALVGREAKECGLHYIVDYIKSGGGFISLSSEGELGAQSLKLKQGTSAIATGLARALPYGSIMLNSPVVDVQQHEGGCRVRTDNSFTVQCKKVLFAIPTNTYDKIQFSPPLPAAKRAIVSRTKGGVYAKVALTYARPWWREIGLVGSFSSFIGPCCFSWETSDRESEAHSLMIFVAGKAAAQWRTWSNLRREEALLTHLAELVGPEHGQLVLDVLEINQKEWTTEAYIEGAPTAAMGTGELSRYGQALRQPFGALHFGGGETAYEWKGYLEGALLAGARSAAEVIKTLAPGSRL